MSVGTQGYSRTCTKSEATASSMQIAEMPQKVHCSQCAAHRPLLLHRVAWACAQGHRRPPSQLAAPSSPIDRSHLRRRSRGPDPA